MCVFAACTSQADRQAHFIKIYGKDAGVPSNVSLALDGAPSLIDNPRQLALEKARREEKQKRAAAIAAAETNAPTRGGGGGGVPQEGRMYGQGTPAARPLQVESRGKGGKRRIQPMLVSNNGGGAPSATPLVLTAPAALTLEGREPRWERTGGVPGVGTVSEGFGSEATAVSAGASPRSGHKRPRIGGGLSGGGGGSGSGGHSRHHAIGGRPREGTVVRLRAGGAVPVVSPPELMPRRGASGSLVRQIAGSGREGEGGDAFRPSTRLREAANASRGGGGVGFAEDGRGKQAGSGAAVMECSALDEEFRGLPARRYTLVTVTRGGREVWRDYVAGMATACCGNARVAAVGAEDGSVYVYDRCGAPRRARGSVFCVGVLCVHIPCVLCVVVVVGVIVGGVVVMVLLLLLLLLLLLCMLFLCLVEAIAQQVVEPTALVTYTVGAMHARV